MRKGLTALCCALLLTGAAILGMGVYLKYSVLKPLDLCQNTSAMAVPFLMLADPGLRQSIEDGKHPPAASEPEPTPASTEPLPTESVSEPWTEPETQPPEPPRSTDPVDVSWYDDVLFIGDSRTVGLRDYARLGNADYFCDVGMTVFDCRTRALSDAGFSSRTLEALLSSKTYGKVFISLGINECGYPIDSLMRAYTALVETVRELQPEAVILLQGIMTVGREKAQSAACFRPENLFAINERIAALADNEGVYYIDVNTVFADENGYLLSEISGDGVHLYVKCYGGWVDWISRTVGQLGI